MFRSHRKTSHQSRCTKLWAFLTVMKDLKTWTQMHLSAENPTISHLKRSRSEAD